MSSCWELMEADGIGGLGEVRILSEDAPIFEEGGLEINGEGRLIAKNQVSFNQLLGEIELRHVAGETHPQLFIKGKATPFADVLAEENKVRILQYNKEFAVSNTLYAVEDETVLVRANAEITDNNVVGKVHKGNLVVSLSEENGWYQVKVVQGTRITYGWIQAGALTPLVLGTPNGYDCSRERSGNYTFVNHTNYRCGIELYSADMPSIYIGNPGLQNMGEATIEPQQSQTLYNLKSNNYKYRLTIARRDFRGQYIMRMGQIKVETCQTLKMDIK